MKKPRWVWSRSTVRTFACVLIGVALVQAAWVLAVPPFRGVDEHEHAYKAAAVARGDWSAHHAASEQGWGEFVTVPRSLVEAATPVCESLEYTTEDNCRPGAERDGDTVLVASSAARYNPAFYFVIGTAARAFDGTAALYAMRAIGAALCALLIALAAVATRLWARTPWPMVGVLVAATPTFLYSNAVAAPNGVEGASAMLVWAALLGLARSLPSSPHIRTFLVLATIGALPLATVRGLGVLWLGLIVGTTAILLSADHLKQLMRRRDAQVSAAIIGSMALLGVGWTLYASVGDTSTVTDDVPGSPWPEIPAQVFVWFLQSVAAIPTRTEPSPAVVYAIVIVTWSILAFLGVRRASRQGRTALVAVLLVSTVVPVAATVATYEQIGFAWQGRYMYPYSMGFLLICGYILDRSRRAPGMNNAWPVWAAAALAVSAQLIGQLDLVATQLATSPLSGTSAWRAPTPVVLIALTVGGAAVLGWALSRPCERDPDHELDRDSPASAGRRVGASSVGL